MPQGIAPVDWFDLLSRVVRRYFSHGAAVRNPARLLSKIGAELSHRGCDDSSNECRVFTPVQELDSCAPSSNRKDARKKLASEEASQRGESDVVMGVPYRVVQQSHGQSGPVGSHVVSILVETAVREYLEEKRSDLCPGAWQNRRHSLKWLLEAFPGRILAEIQPAEFRHAIVSSRDGRAKATWNFYRTSFLALVAWSAVGHYIDRNNLVDIHGVWKWERVKDKDRRRTKIDYEPEEIEALCAACDDPMTLYVRAACWLGFRMSELIGAKGLSWGDVNAAFEIFIPGTRRKNGKDFYFPIPSKLRPFLGERKGPDDPLIPGVYKANLWRRLQRIAKRINFPKHISPHHFRRTWCYWFKRAGGTKEEAMEIQDWADTNVLLRSYWHEMEVSEKRRLIERM